MNWLIILNWWHQFTTKITLCFIFVCIIIMTLKVSIKNTWFYCAWKLYKIILSTKCLSDVGLAYSYCFVFFLYAVWFYKHHRYFFLRILVFNTQYATYSCFVFLLKMKYGWNFWLKVSFSIIMNTRKICFEISPCANLFSGPLICFIKVWFWSKNTNSIKNDLLCVHPVCCMKL